MSVNKVVGKKKALELLQQGYSMCWSRWGVKAIIRTPDTTYTVRYDAFMELTHKDVNVKLKREKVKSDWIYSLNKS